MAESVWNVTPRSSSVGSRHARPYERQRLLLSGTPLRLERLALCHVVGDEKVLDLADQVVAYITDVKKRSMRDRFRSNRDQPVVPKGLAVPVCSASMTPISRDATMQPVNAAASIRISTSRGRRPLQPLTARSRSQKGRRRQRAIHRQARRFQTAGRRRTCSGSLWASR
jgi:hypothetical protein